MTQILCKVVGHRDYDRKVLASRPWEDLDINGFAKIDFRSSICLRCGHSLPRERD